jgi:AcrR family transcriptional regulator
MTSSAKLPPRERLLRAATDLFYREGITATGVDKLCQTAGISKKSMYQLFATKDELVAESLTHSGPATIAGLFAPPIPDPTPRERIRYVFERLEELAASPEYRGCPFVNVATELRDPGHAASRVAHGFKQAMTDYFATQAELAGATDPQTLAKQLTIVYDGAAARSVMQATGLDGLSLLTADALLAANGVHPPEPESGR